jgi:hypothetical protein
MNRKVINNKTYELLEFICTSRITNKFYLVGGTALALQLGHRKSIDLDFFAKFF